MQRYESSLWVYIFKVIFFDILMTFCYILLHIIKLINKNIYKDNYLYFKAYLLL